MTRPEQVTLVYGDDWAGLYLDGQLAVEGHSLTETQVLRALGIPYETVDADHDWLYDQDSLPARLGDVRRGAR